MLLVAFVPFTCNVFRPLHAPQQMQPTALFSDGLCYGQYCKICPHNRVAENENLPDHTIIYGENQRRTAQAGLEEPRAKAVEKHVETLKGMGMR